MLAFCIGLPGKGVSSFPFLSLTSPVEALSPALGSLHPVLSQYLLAPGLGPALLMSLLA